MLSRSFLSSRHQVLTTNAFFVRFQKTCCVVCILPSPSKGSTSSGESGCGTGPSYVFSGSHCPLVVRLVTEVLNAKYGTTAYNVVEELTRELQVKVKSKP